jgi:hypothetical protein
MTDILLDRLRGCGAAEPPDGGLQVVDLVELLPRQIAIRAAEVAVRGSLCVDGGAASQVADDGAGPQIQRLGDGQMC